ncbi:MAG: tRNA adenosine(34) deaminase TadA [Pseudomonadota bacterium]
MSHESYMREALNLARQAESLGEVPVGAVIVLDDEIIGRGWNHPIAANDPSAHAEIVALRDAAKTVGNYRLPQTTLYVTIEPCVMCVGAIVHSRVEHLVYGAPEPRSGAVKSAFSLLEHGLHNHSVTVTPGILHEECAQLMREFFAARR